MAGTATPVTTSAGRNFICLTGFVQRAPQVDIFQRGTHRLVGLGGGVIATLRSNRVNLFALEGRFVTVCGLNEGEIEGVTSLLVTQAFPVASPAPQPPPQQFPDLTLLLLLLLLSRFGFFGRPFGAGGNLGLGNPGLGNLGLGSLGLGSPGLGSPGLGTLGFGGTPGLGSTQFGLPTATAGLGQIPGFSL